uniref:Uncharacterized protein n=1 Tax=Opuntia streptacantha TaxID=393608 RepID=A0A7C9ARD0_OPUST
MSLLRSLGRLRITPSSSTPLVSCHLYCSYLLILFLSSSGSKRWDIHCSASCLLTLISSSRTVVACRYFCMFPISNEKRNSPNTQMKPANKFSPSKVLVLRS